MARQYETALHLFPAEIWKEILVRISDPRTRVNLLYAYESLGRQFENDRLTWLMEMVINVERFQNAVGMENSVNVMRQVNRSVTTSLNQGIIESRQLEAWHDFPSNPLPTSIRDWTTSVLPFNFDQRWDLGGWEWCRVRGDTIIVSHDSFQRWWQLHEIDPPNYNPFPTKSLYVCVKDDEPNGENFLGFNRREMFNWPYMMNALPHVEFDICIDRLSNLSIKFGYHIQQLKIRCVDLTRPDSLLSFFNCLANVLKHLPNLKELAFIGGNFLYDLRHPLTDLPEKVIETLSLIGHTNIVSTMLFQKYAVRARKLILDLRVISTNSTRVLQYAPLQTRELVILNDCGRIMRYWMDRAERELVFVGFPTLVKLTIDWNTGTANHIIRLLPLFPTLRFLEMKEHPRISFVGAPIRQLLRGPLPRILFIVLPFRQIFNYDFLDNFQQIKEIKLVSKFPKPTAWIRQDNLHVSHIFPRLHEFVVLGRVYNSNIWNRLPALQKICVDWNGGDADFYNRVGINCA